MVGIGNAELEDATSPSGPEGVWAVTEQQAPLERVLFQVKVRSYRKCLDEVEVTRDFAGREGSGGRWGESH